MLVVAVAAVAVSSIKLGGRMLDLAGKGFIAKRWCAGAVDFFTVGTVDVVGSDTASADENNCSAEMKLSEEMLMSFPTNISSRAIYEFIFDFYCTNVYVPFLAGRLPESSSSQTRSRACFVVVLLAVEVVVLAAGGVLLIFNWLVLRVMLFSPLIFLDPETNPFFKSCSKVDLDIDGMGGISVLAIVDLFRFSSSRMASLSSRDEPLLPMLLAGDLLLTDLGRWGFFCCCCCCCFVIDR